MITKTSIQELKDKIDIVEIISTFIQVKKFGPSYKACCPFHNEKTPSFIINPQKQIFHCFGCSKGGDAISFVMEFEKLTYPEALEKIATLLNFSLTYENQSSAINQKMLEHYNSFLQEKIKEDQNEQYLFDRGLNKNSIEKFNLGFAPKSNETIDFLRKNFFDITEATEIGIVSYGDNGLFARFSERITFPVFNQNGKLVGFGGRTIKNHPAKYVNSPATKTFNKSTLLYAYNLAKEKIFTSKEIIITEGYLDTILLHQAGFENTVATLGTALTTQHLPLLKRGEPKVILLFDGDEAGIKAAIKTSALLASNSFEGRAVILGEQKDPADYIREGRAAELSQMIAEATPFVKFVITNLTQGNMQTPEQKQKVVTEIENFLNSLKPVIAEEYRSYAAQLLNLHPKYIKLSCSTRSSHTNMPSIDASEILILQGILNFPEKREMIISALDESMFNTHQTDFILLLSGKDDILANMLEMTGPKMPLLEEYKSQLILFLRNFYKKRMEIVLNNADMSFSEKMAFKREYEKNDERLRQGILFRFLSL